ncbi:MAG: response regulator, partial [SAR324 cluster bacterium]|nr:response regulator [SAR324 cluster bacterium]
MRKTRADIPIILCTGYSETMNPESSKALGINAFLYKPIEPREMGRVVREVLDEGQQADRSKSGRQGRVDKNA